MIAKPARVNKLFRFLIDLLKGPNVIHGLAVLCGVLCGIGELCGITSLQVSVFIL